MFRLLFCSDTFVFRTADHVYPRDFTQFICHHPPPSPTKQIARLIAQAFGGSPLLFTCRRPKTIVVRVSRRCAQLQLGNRKKNAAVRKPPQGRADRAAPWLTVLTSVRPTVAERAARDNTGK